MAEQIEVVPSKDGSWNWRRRSEGGAVTEKSDSFDTRSEAIGAARDVRAGERVVLLRVDGSEYGELNHAERDGDAQSVDLTAAGENGEVA